MDNIKLFEEYKNHVLDSGLSNNRLLKLEQMFNTVSRALPKMADANKDIIKAFVNDLNNDRFLKRDGEKYSGSSKSDIKKFLKQFYKWLQGGDEVYPESVAWIKCKIGKDERPEEKPVYTIDEVLKIAQQYHRPEYAITPLLLFDSGFRIAELMSCRKQDLVYEDFDEGKKTFWLSCRESKTFTRKVPIPLFHDEIQSYVNSFQYKQLKDDDLLLKISYGYLLKSFQQIGKKVFQGGKQHLTPHSLRHSSATHYSKVFDGNMNIIADRFGWSYSSDELKLYIRKSGAYQRVQARKVYENDIVTLKNENEQLKHQMQKQQEETKRQFQELQEALFILQKHKK